MTLIDYIVKDLISAKPLFDTLEETSPMILQQLDFFQDQFCLRKNEFFPNCSFFLSIKGSKINEAASQLERKIVGSPNIKPKAEKTTPVLSPQTAALMTSVFPRNSRHFLNDARHLKDEKSLIKDFKDMEKTFNEKYSRNDRAVFDYKQFGCWVGSPVEMKSNRYLHDMIGENSRPLLMKDSNHFQQKVDSIAAT